MLAAGSLGLARHKWAILGVYLVQLGLSAVVGLVGMLGVSAAFGNTPALDRGLNGSLPDMVGLISRGGDGVWLGLILTAFGISLAYAVVSWFLHGGLIALFLENPTSGRARVFGAGGSATLPAFFRLWLVSLVPYLLLVGVALAIGSSASREAMREAMTPGEYFGTMARAYGPAAVLALMVSTVVDYARVEIARHPGVGALRGFARGSVNVFTSWKPFVHSFILAALAAVALYVYFGITDGWAPVTAGGAWALFAARQGATATRFACYVSRIAGQVEFTERR